MMAEQPKDDSAGEPSEAENDDSVSALDPNSTRQPPPQEEKAGPHHTGLHCLVAVARRHGVDLSVDRLRHDYALDQTEPDVTLLARMAKENSLKVKIDQLTWDDLNGIGGAFPLLAILKNGNVVVFTG
ncbi:MAG: cysteine peptidase family C39 domain-containing protein, partial [Pseudomonadota bacterium]